MMHGCIMNTKIGDAFLDANIDGMDACMQRGWVHKWIHGCMDGNMDAQMNDA